MALHTNAKLWFYPFTCIPNGFSAGFVSIIGIDAHSVCFEICGKCDICRNTTHTPYTQPTIIIIKNNNYSNNIATARRKLFESNSSTEQKEQPANGSRKTKRTTELVDFNYIERI